MVLQNGVETVKRFLLMMPIRILLLTTTTTNEKEVKKMDNAENSSLPNFYISLVVKKHTLAILSIFFEFLKQMKRHHFPFFLPSSIIICWLLSIYKAYRLAITSLNASKTKGGCA
ncbi:MAG: hypothetical protein DLM72_20290 [Candidatus Nitrosopolaris wilkensis]|nr:MAG: hypothetical protein DLM72_20290 [Candidatus Nitrosopolaris wilkensis]